MVIRAGLHKLIDGFFLRAFYIVLPDRMPSHREANQNQLPPVEAASALCSLRPQLSHYLDLETEPLTKKIPKAADKPDELISNPEYEAWAAKDQQIFNYLLSSISKEVMVQVSTCTTSAEMWKAIKDMTMSQSPGRVIKTRMALAIAQKGSSTVADFFSKMKSLADNMASAGKKLEDEEITSYILVGLDSDFNPVMSAMQRAWSC